MVPFEFKKPSCNPEIREGEFGYVANLNQFIKLNLDENEKYDTYTFIYSMGLIIIKESCKFLPVNPTLIINLKNSCLL